MKRILWLYDPESLTLMVRLMVCSLSVLILAHVHFQTAEIKLQRLLEHANTGTMLAPTCASVSTV